MDITKKLDDRQIDGTVERMVIGGRPVTRGIVIGDIVYESLLGGRPRAIGYVKDGVAYESVYGGRPRILGNVKYRRNE